VLQNGQADGEVRFICRFSCSAVEPATLLKSRRMEVLTGLHKAKKPRLWSGQFDGGNRGEGYAVGASNRWSSSLSVRMRAASCNIAMSFGAISAPVLPFLVFSFMAISASKWAGNDLPPVSA
jgi:hypothetical protein